MVVGHSAACTLAWLAADARPEKVAKVALIGGFPSADGEAYADFFEAKDGLWRSPAGGRSREQTLPTSTRRPSAPSRPLRIPVPEGVTKGVVHLATSAGSTFRSCWSCPEFDPVQAQAWIDEGELPELAKARHVDLVDIDSGTGRWSPGPRSSPSSSRPPRRP